MERQELIKIRPELTYEFFTLKPDARGNYNWDRPDVARRGFYKNLNGTQLLEMGIYTIDEVFTKNPFNVNIRKPVAAYVSVQDEGGSTQRQFIMSSEIQQSATTLSDAAPAPVVADKLGKAERTQYEQRISELQRDKQHLQDQLAEMQSNLSNAIQKMEQAYRDKVEAEGEAAEWRARYEQSETSFAATIEKMQDDHQREIEFVQRRGDDKEALLRELEALKAQQTLSDNFNTRKIDAEIEKDKSATELVRSIMPIGTQLISMASQYLNDMRQIKQMMLISQMDVQRAEKGLPPMMGDYLQKSIANDNAAQTRATKNGTFDFT